MTTTPGFFSRWFGAAITTIACLAGAVSVGGCGGGAAGGEHAPKDYSLAGVVQKGPFVLGTAVHVAELDDTLAPTGLSYDTTISDDTGAFSLPSVKLASPYVQLTANGFYFDEVGGALSVAPIQLSALADVTNAASINTNLLSHLAKGRVQKLISDGKSFTDAKTQAQAEVLAIFGITKTVAAAETLNIANGTDDDAILLTVSAIVQALHTPAELSELLAKISADLAPDGTLDDAQLGIALAVGAKLVDPAIVRSNLAARYQSLGVSATVPDFTSLVQTFIATNHYLPAGAITYPAMGTEGANLLAAEVASIDAHNMWPTLAFAAIVPVGQSLRVHVKCTGATFLSTGNSGGWSALGTDETDNDFLVTPAETARTCDSPASISFEGSPDPHTLIIDVYENGATMPTLSKTVTLLQ